MNLLLRIQKKMVVWLFENFIKEKTTIEFKRVLGGKDVECQIRMYGWLVGRETILKSLKKEGKV